MLLFSVWAAFFPFGKEGWRLAAYGVLGFLVLLTGSRAGFAAAALSFAVYAGAAYFRFHQGRLWIRPGPLLATGLVTGLLLTASPLLVRGVAKMVPPYEGPYGIAERMDSLIRGDFGQTGPRGQSTMQPRILRKLAFFHLSGNRPFFGYGIGAQEWFQKKGQLLFSCHDQYLMLAFEGGWLVVLFYLMLNMSVGLQPQRAELERRQGAPFVLQFLAAVFWFGFFTNTLLDSRTYVCLMGFLAGLLRKTDTTRKGREDEDSSCD